MRTSYTLEWQLADGTRHSRLFTCEEGLRARAERWAAILIERGNLRQAEIIRIEEGWDAKREMTQRTRTTVALYHYDLIKGWVVERSTNHKEHPIRTGGRQRAVQTQLEF